MTNKRIKDKHRRISVDFAKELDEIKISRINNHRDKKLMSDARLTKGILTNEDTNSLWNEIKKSLIRMPRLDKRALGGLLSIITWMIVVLVTVVFFAGLIFVFGIFTETITDLPVTPDLPSVNMSKAAEDTFGQLNQSLQALRLVSMAIIFALMLSIFLSNFMIRANPAWFFAYFLVVALSVVLSVPISNAYETLAIDRVFGGTLETFTVGNYILLNLPVVVVVLGFFGGIFLFINITRDPAIGGSPI